MFFGSAGDRLVATTRDPRGAFHVFVGTMIYAETPRLILRALAKTDLPRVAELLNDWEVVRWLIQVPHPYNRHDAEEFYQRMAKTYERGAPEYFLLQQKSDGAQIGAIGLHPSREANPKPGELVIGYWLGRSFWGQGLMSEAIRPVIDIAFQRPRTDVVTSTTDPANQVSQNVLRKVGFRYLGIFPHEEIRVLRGPNEVTHWQILRDEYEKRKIV